MSKNLKIFLGISYLIILFAFLYFIFTGIEISRLNDFSYYKDFQKNLSDYVSENIIINIIYFFIFAVLWVALLGFGAPLLIISGILFGQWIGTLVSIISISVGALILYSIGDFFFRDLVKNTLEQKFEKYIVLFKKNEFYYFFIYRFIGGLGVPFGLQNLIPILFGMKKSNYFFSSFFGFLPGFFIFNTIGSGLNSYVAQSEKFNILDYLDNKVKSKETIIKNNHIKHTTTFFPGYSVGDRTRSFFKVQDGCNYFCSFCTIPLARGRSRSGTINETVLKAKELAKNPIKEVVLTGVNIGDFGHGTKENFFELIKELDKVEGIERYRISSIEPDLLTEEIIEFVKNSKKFFDDKN